MKTKQNILEELERIQNLFEHKRGVVLSEQNPLGFKGSQYNELKSKSPKILNGTAFDCLKDWFSLKDEKQVIEFGDKDKKDLLIRYDWGDYWSFGASGGFSSSSDGNGTWSCNRPPEPIGFKIKMVDGRIYDSVFGRFKLPEELQTQPKKPSTKTVTPQTSEKTKQKSTSTKSTSTKSTSAAIPTELQQNVGSETGVQAFQTWLDSQYPKGWAKSKRTGQNYIVSKQSNRGYGSFGPNTQRMWNSPEIKNAYLKFIGKGQETKTPTETPDEFDQVQDVEGEFEGLTDIDAGEKGQYKN